jgi:hypothetical protein
MRNWDALTLQEKIESFPDRHHLTFKCVLYLSIFVTPIPWEQVDLLMRKIGFVRMAVSEDAPTEFEDEEHRVYDGKISVSAPTYVFPDEVQLE